MFSSPFSSFSLLLYPYLNLLSLPSFFHLPLIPSLLPSPPSNPLFNLPSLLSFFPFFSFFHFFFLLSSLLPSSFLILPSTSSILHSFFYPPHISTSPLFPHSLHIFNPPSLLLSSPFSFQPSFSSLTIPSTCHSIPPLPSSDTLFSLPPGPLLSPTQPQYGPVRPHAYEEPPAAAPPVPASGLPASHQWSCQRSSHRSTSHGSSPPEIRIDWGLPGQLHHPGR